MWRTGANEATTITFSDDVTINGQALPKGTCSLHTIPGKDEWTIVFNNTANQWGSFNYDPAKDALRVKAKPQTAPFAEWMTFEFPSVTPGECRGAVHDRHRHDAESDARRRVILSCADSEGSQVARWRSFVPLRMTYSMTSAATTPTTHPITFHHSQARFVNAAHHSTAASPMIAPSDAAVPLTSFV